MSGLGLAGAQIHLSPKPTLGIHFRRPEPVDARQSADIEIMSKLRLRVRGSMCRLSMIGWLIVGAVAGAIDGEDAVDPDLAGFDGTWRMVSLTVNGKQVDPKKLATLRFEILSGNISTRRSGIEVAKSSFTVDASKSPMQF